jgi:hypothetical protein
VQSAYRRNILEFATLALLAHCVQMWMPRETTVGGALAGTLQQCSLLHLALGFLLSLF